MSHSTSFVLESRHVTKHDLVPFVLKRSTMSEWQPDVVVNCAALSVPSACEADPAAAMSINVPSTLLEWLSTFKEANTLLIHLSTDQGKLLSLKSLLVSVFVLNLGYWQLVGP